jgi:hypothetical protein
VGSGLLEGVECVVMAAGGAVEAGKAEAGLRGADVVARAGEGLFCQRDGVAEAMCLGVQQGLHGQCPAVASVVAAVFAVIGELPEGKTRWSVDDAKRRVGHQVDTPVSPQEKVTAIHALAQDDQVAAEVTGDLLHRPHDVRRRRHDPVVR